MTKIAIVNPLEFRHVRAFLAVAEHLHFARAADALDMAPPALTRQIQEAERLLGVRLFDRSRRAVTLTAAGEAFGADARAAFEHLQRGHELALRAERGEVGRIEIGYVSSAVYSGTLQRTVGAFRASHPRIDLNLREVPMDDVAKQLDAGRLDLAYVRPPLPLPGGVRTVTLQRDVFVAAVPADSRYASMPTLRAADLADARFAVPEQEGGTLEVARRGRFAPVIDGAAGRLARGARVRVGERLRRGDPGRAGRLRGAARRRIPAARRQADHVGARARASPLREGARGPRVPAHRRRSRLSTRRGGRARHRAPPLARE